MLDVDNDGSPVEDTTADHFGPSVRRRSVVRGLAWTVPVVAVGAAAPAFAVSGCFNLAAMSITGPKTSDPGFINYTNEYGPNSVMNFRFGSYLTFTAQWCNLGSTAIPAGVVFEVSYLTQDNFEPITIVSVTGMTYTNVVKYHRQLPDYTPVYGQSSGQNPTAQLTSTSPIAPGACVTITYRTRYVSKTAAQPQVGGYPAVDALVCSSSATSMYDNTPYYSNWKP